MKKITDDKYLYNMNDTMKMLGNMTVTEFCNSKQVEDVINAYREDNKDKNSLFSIMLKYYIPLLADIYNLGKVNSNK